MTKFSELLRFWMTKKTDPLFAAVNQSTINLSTFSSS